MHGQQEGLIMCGVSPAAGVWLLKLGLHQFIDDSSFYCFKLRGMQFAVGG